MVQIRITKAGKHFIAEGYVRFGQVLWVADENATNKAGTGYIDTGLAESLGAGVGAEETPVPGPRETPQPGPTEKPAPGPHETPLPSPTGKKVIRRRRGWPLDRFSEVERGWDGGVVVSIATGPSLSSADIARVEAWRREGGQRYVVAINDAYRLAPFADVLYFADWKWWTWHKARPEFIAFNGIKVTIEPTGLKVDDPAVHMLRNADPPRERGGGLSFEADRVITGRNSGYQAINLAVLAGARLIVLLGYDGKVGIGGNKHFFGDHPDNTPAPSDLADNVKYYRTMVEPLKQAGVQVINASPGSAIDAFPKTELCAALTA